MAYYDEINFCESTCDNDVGVYNSQTLYYYFVT